MNNKAIDAVEAVSSLFMQYFRPLVLFANNYIPDQSANEDIVQDVFMSLMESGKNFDSEQSLKAYLYVAVRNRCLKYLRHKEVRQRHGEVYLNELRNDALFSNYVIEEDLLSRLIGEIEKLPAYYRNVFLRSIKGDSNRKIADELGLSIETVGSYKKEGRALLRKRLGNLDSFKSMLALFGL